MLHSCVLIPWVYNSEILAEVASRNWTLSNGNDNTIGLSNFLFYFLPSAIAISQEKKKKKKLLLPSACHNHKQSDTIYF